MKEQRDLVKYWSNYLENEKSFLKAELTKRKTTKFNNGEWKSDFKKPSHLRKDLIPVPYAGKLTPSTGRVYILSINPGVSLLDYSYEHSNSTSSRRFKNALKSGLRQKFSEKDYPNLFFNPEFWWHPGANYWQGKLSDIIALYIRKHGKNEEPEKIFHKLAHTFTFLEVIPYHSKQGPGSCSTMESVKLMKAFVRKLAGVKKKRFLLIVLKGSNRWEIGGTRRNIINFPHLAQSSPMGRTSKIGKAMIKFLKL